MFASRVSRTLPVYSIFLLCLTRRLLAAPAPASIPSALISTPTLTALANATIEARVPTDTVTAGPENCEQLSSLISAGQYLWTPLVSACSLSSCSALSSLATASAWKTTSSTSCLVGDLTPTFTGIDPLTSCSVYSDIATKSWKTTSLETCQENDHSTTAIIFPTTPCASYSTIAISQSWTASRTTPCVDASGSLITGTILPTLTTCTYWSDLASKSHWLSTVTEVCLTNGGKPTTVGVSASTAASTTTMTAKITTSNTVATASCTYYFNSASLAHISQATTIPCTTNGGTSTTVTIYPPSIPSVAPQCLSFYASIAESNTTAPPGMNSLMDLHMFQGQHGCKLVPGIIPYYTSSTEYQLSCDANGPGASGYVIYKSDGDAGTLTIVYQDQYMNENTGPIKGTKLPSPDSSYGGSWTWGLATYTQGCTLPT